MKNFSFKKSQAFSILVLAFITLGLSSCQKDSELKTTSGKVLSLQAPSGIYLGSERQLLHDVIDLKGNEVYNVDQVEITNITYLNLKSGMVATITYKRPDGSTSNYIIVKDIKVPLYDDTKVAKSSRIESSSSEQSGGGTTVKYRCTGDSCCSVVASETTGQPGVKISCSCSNCTLEQEF